MQVTLAVATYNQADLLRAFLDAWRRGGADLVPLLVIDDGSEDATPRVLAEAAHPRLDARRHPHASIAHARNRALRAAATPWVAFTDTDCILSRRYFETLAQVPARFASAAAVEGAVRPVPGPKPPFTHSLRNDGGGYATANMVFRVDEALAAGGFDEAFGNYREDADLALTLLERGRGIAFCPELVVEHPHLPRPFLRTLRSAWRNQDRILASEMRLWRKHPAAYARLRHHPDARGTLAAWRRRYFAPYFKECFRYLFCEHGIPVRRRLLALRPSAQAMIAALAEQACILGLWVVKWRKLAESGEA